MSTPKPKVRLDLFRNPEFDRGASRFVEFAWIVIQATLFSSWIPGSNWRRVILRLFGAKIGRGVVIKPRVYVKFPWRLRIGNHTWLGERVWIDNLDQVTIGDHTCLSQNAYLCTGNHDWSDVIFALVTKPIKIGSGCWIGARATLAPGTIVNDGAVVSMNQLAAGEIARDAILLPNGDIKIRPERINKPK